LQERRGVCQDFAHLAITCFRAFGLPARYVSGYLLTYPPPGMEKLKGADASHAWISVWAPEAGWVDFDPTNGIMPVDEHITVAHGRDYDDVSPISGVLLGGSGQEMAVAVDVTVAG
jgi:transglutaminase-like putative cysteine protease